MRNVLRMLLTAGVVASLVLCMVAAVFWVRSYRVHDSAGMLLGRHDLVFESAPGSSRLTWYTDRRLRIESGWTTGDLDRSPTSDPILLTEHRLWGFGVDHGTDDHGMPEYPPEVRRTVVLPYWSVVAASAIAPLAVIIRGLTRRRRAANERCAGCGYDLRATPERCPECGRAAGASAGDAAS